MKENQKNGIMNYLSLVKFGHTIFAMPFAFIGFFLAVWYNDFPFDWTIFIGVILCMIFARTAAMAFNRYADREIDGKNPRTALREIPAGIIRAESAMRLILISSLLFIATTWFINRMVFFLSPVALLIILGYSITKKFTSLSHFVLGLGLSLAPIGAYLSVTAEFHILPLLYSAVVIFWVGGFDILYALQDETFDKNEDLFSIPVRFGRRGAMFISALAHILTGILVIVAGLYGGFGMWYWIGAGIFLVLLTYQHTILSVEDISRVNLAFATTNGIASLIFAFFTILDLYHF
ncbi:MAG: UbiA-like polyprenyltransferase [Bacteroidales bacterium]